MYRSLDLGYLGWNSKLFYTPGKYGEGGETEIFCHKHKKEQIRFFDDGNLRNRTFWFFFLKNVHTISLYMYLEIVDFYWLKKIFQFGGE